MPHTWIQIPRTSILENKSRKQIYKSIFVAFLMLQDFIHKLSYSHFQFIFVIKIGYPLPKSCRCTVRPLQVVVLWDRMTRYPGSSYFFRIQNFQNVLLDCMVHNALKYKWTTPGKVTYVPRDSKWVLNMVEKAISWAFIWCILHCHSFSSSGDIHLFTYWIMCNVCLPSNIKSSITQNCTVRHNAPFPGMGHV